MADESIVDVISDDLVLKVKAEAEEHTDCDHLLCWTRSIVEAVAPVLAADAELLHRIRMVTGEFAQPSTCGPECGSVPAPASAEPCACDCHSCCVPLDQACELCDHGEDGGEAAREAPPNAVDLQVGAVLREPEGGETP